MKKLLLAVVLCLGLTGCAEGYYYYDPPGVYQVGTVEFCDDWGCRMVAAPYYYVGGEVVYFDAHFGCWIGPNGYWVSGRWYRGTYPGYHGWYHAGWYHHFHYNEGGWKMGSGYHGYHRGPPPGHHR